MTTEQSSIIEAVVKEVYSAINRNDIPAFLKFFDPQIELIDPPGLPSADTYRGYEAFKAHVTQARDTWAEGSCEPEQFVIAGNKIILLVFVRVRLKSNLEWIEGRLADVFTFRNGKIIQMISFSEKHHALEMVGVKDVVWRDFSDL